MDKVLNWPAVKAENVSLLLDYAFFLRGCNNVMSDLIFLNSFRSTACDIREKQRQKPNFNYVVWFVVEHEVKLLSDPILGSKEGT